MLACANTLYFTFDESWIAAPDRRPAMLSKVVATTALALWFGVMYWGSMLPFIGNAF
jgi:hypothetical protein